MVLKLFAARKPAGPPGAEREDASGLLAFVKTEAAGGIVLIVATVLALVLANSPLGPAYRAALHGSIGPLSLHHWINDGAMALFFLLVGLELKRELLVGDLTRWQDRILPGAAALAGMVVPGLLYLAIAGRTGGAEINGWAIPAATDIAFALGILGLLGTRVPPSLKVLLTAIAVIDDLGAIIIIAVFFTSQIAVLPLLAAAVAIAALFTLSRLRVRALWPYLGVGACLWVAVLLSGVHATLAGVVTAAFIPLTRSDGAPSPLHRLEHALHPYVAFGIVPLFALANAGVAFAGLGAGAVTGVVPLGILAGLVIGKQIGVFGALAAVIASGQAAMPTGAGWRHIHGVSILCGIGFTMSLFIGGLAFGEDLHLQDGVKVGVLAASAVSALMGYLVLRIAGRSQGVRS
jgi:NhaA family Na+:H+ antiporter